MNLQKYGFALFLLCFVFNTWGQKVSKTITIDSVFFELDSLSISPNSFLILKNKRPVSDSLYELNSINSTLTWKGEIPVNLQVEYVLLSIDFSKIYQNKDTSQIQPVFDYKNPFKSNGNSPNFCCRCPIEMDGLMHKHSKHLFITKKGGPASKQDPL